MGKNFQLFGMVEQRNMDEPYYSMKPAERLAAIEALAQSTELIGMYSPEEFTVSFHGKAVTIKQGWNEYAPVFAVWALQKYGKGSKYGKTFRTDESGKMVFNPELLDENPDGEAVKRTRKAKTEEVE